MGDGHPAHVRRHRLWCQRQLHDGRRRRRCRRSAIGFQFVLPGLSDSANLVAFYDKGQFQARVAYNWRDEFLNGTRNNSPHYTEEFGQWDLRFNWLATDNLNLFVEGINVTSESQRIYNRWPNQFTDATQFEARWAIGARYSF